MEPKVVLSSPNQLALVVPTAPDTVSANEENDESPNIVVEKSKGPEASSELMGADPNTSDSPPLAINDPAAVITMEVIAPLHAMLLSCDHVKTTQGNHGTTAQWVSNSGRWLAID
jgi:hypothetical protein